MASTQDTTLVIGGGVVGMALAFGLARRGERVIVLDGSDRDFRASRGNFGLIWGQGKGVAMPRYAEISLSSCAQWSTFAAELEQRTGVDVQFRGGGGIDLCMTPEEVAPRLDDYRRSQQASPGLARRFHWEWLDRNQLEHWLPGIGPDIPGGTWSPHDGHCNPLLLLRALHAACRSLGVEHRFDHRVDSIHPLATGFEVHTAQGRFHGTRLILAAGLGNASLAPPLGLFGDVFALRGQVLVTERLPITPRLPTPQVRQTDSGSFQCGETHERAGLDKATTPALMEAIARDTLRVYPFLRHRRMVRAWGALRVMTPDEHPVYEASSRYPGAYSVSCHSGITLAAFHAKQLAEAIANDHLARELPEFSGARFDVSTA
ncbi:NAD(P)/FAD-dependent oxidoreductase [Kushneria phosphatilytica]|uniref:FAD-binding oxidoreductase n=1 Tax=Kushneria phosphatilytica TaxID=657387 RepID=A0A1S1NWB6_9GAMM|nr:FAD-dependent oxidoreductase [Kushneria phosphatilytica]OHV08461.1 hypothetical protein BH688_14275 [Kushneria phosphatilytica]QEL09891.1 FAD-binding oxidoreductase [Kushneria phosphatilytica]